MKNWLVRFCSQARPAELRIGAKQPLSTKRLQRSRSHFDARQGLALEMTGETGIAVLPFTDLAPQPEHPYLADGFARDLAQVISLNPSFYAEVIEIPHTESSMEGAAVSVEHDLLLEGTVARAGRHLHATVRVIECASGEILWSDRFAAPLERVATLQDDIAEAIAGAVAATPYFLHVEPRPRGTGCAAAWALRRAARALLHDGPTPSCLDGAVRLFSLSGRLDPLYADARIGLAETLSLRLLLLTTADADADRARRNAVLNAVEALAPCHEELTFIGGLKELDRGRPEKAAAALTRAIRISAIMIPARIFLSIAEARRGRGRTARSDALLAFKRAGRPGWAALADYARAEAALARGSAPEAEAAIDGALTAAGGPDNAPPIVLLMQSLLLAGQGKSQAARAALADHWPAGIPLPASGELKSWLTALPGRMEGGSEWLEGIVQPLSLGN